MKCYECGGTLNKTKIKKYHYLESGLSNIYLKNIEVEKCKNNKCGENIFQYPS